jgi:hypothetical protein
LSRARDVKQLYQWKRQQFDDANRTWRNSRGLWHYRQSLPM